LKPVSDRRITSGLLPSLTYKASKRNPIWRQITSYIEENDIQHFNQLKVSTLTFSMVVSLDPWARQIRAFIDNRRTAARLAVQARSDRITLKAPRPQHAASDTSDEAE
jgi:hypothetical protein